MGVSPDGRYAVTGGNADGWLRFFEVATGREVRSVDTGAKSTYAVGYTGDGRSIVACHGDGSMRVWNAADGTAVKLLFFGEYNTVWAFSRDGKAAACPAGEGAISILETAGWTEVRRLEGHEGGTLHVAFHPRGRHLASTGKDGGVRLWDLGTGKRVRSLADGTAPNFRIAFTADGRSLVAAGSDGTFRIFGEKR